MGTSGYQKLFCDYSGFQQNQHKWKVFSSEQLEKKFFSG
jgi:hypothetical protein